MNIYKLLSFKNDAKAVKKGRIGKRIYNKAVMKTARKFLK